MLMMNNLKVLVGWKFPNQALLLWKLVTVKSGLLMTLMTSGEEEDVLKIQLILWEMTGNRVLVNSCISLLVMVQCSGVSILGMMPGTRS